jgi:hypothetical protein
VTLLDAHASILRSASYRVSITHREFVDGEETGTFVQTVAVANATTYRVRSLRLGTFQDGPVRFDDGDVYADGTTRYERVSGGVNAEHVVGDDPFVGDVVRYVRYYLSVEQSRIADARTLDGTTLVYLRTTGDPWPGVRNSTGSAVVTEDGLVRTVRRGYDDPESDAYVVITIRIADVGRTNVTAPWWVPDGEDE